MTKEESDLLLGLDAKLRPALDKINAERSAALEKIGDDTSNVREVYMLKKKSWLYIRLSRFIANDPDTEAPANIRAVMKWIVAAIERAEYEVWNGHYMDSTSLHTNQLRLWDLDCIRDEHYRLFEMLQPFRPYAKAQRIELPPVPRHFGFMYSDLT